MKKLFNKIKNNPMVYLFIFICVFLLPVALGTVSESVDNAIITAVAIDKDEENGYELSLQVFVPIPNTAYVETYKIVSGKGNSISSAMEKIGLHTGKRIAFAHVRVIIVNLELAKENVVSSLDFLVRNRNLSKNTYLIATEGSAKELLKKSYEMDNSIGLKLEEIVAYNEDYIYASQTTLESFYKGYHSPGKTSIIGIVNLEADEAKGINIKDDASGGGEAGGGAGEGSSGGAGGAKTSGEEGPSAKQKKEVIANKGEVALFKGGEFIKTLTTEIVEGVNWVIPAANVGAIQIEKEVDGKKVIMNFLIRQKRVRSFVNFVGGVPIYHNEINLILHLEEISNQGQGTELNFFDNNLDEEARDLIEKEVKLSYGKALKEMKENKADLIGVYQKFYSKKRGEFKKFLAGLSDPEDYLNNMVFQVSVKSFAS